MTTTYNSKKKPLIFPEYGRHIQKMVDFAVTIEDDEKRKETAYAIVNIMGRMHPNLKDVDDFNHKLWDHLIIMSDYQLNVESPYGNPTPSDTIITPRHIEYKDSDIRYKQYGRILFKMIEEEKNCKTEEEKQALALIVANHIKKSLSIWNSDNVSDELVLEAMEKLSNSRLTLPKDTELVEIRSANSNSSNNSRRKGRKKGR
ncbi:uncharacterized protein DUF4290 [Balneicella halophila]|uniref:Uncharacterized protein DUF4290 n=1 Tax=Balneicella halophila TaxID=1537566 RepID=A0A7L4UNC6_BALHA|nr:DUF4290 domain-containing protein [Balneicella halophila]PVX49975.1 uncharacterized protein DUF4290 [Balneicella halophila]